VTDSASERIATIDRQRSRIVVTSILAVGVLVIAGIRAQPGTVVVVAVMIPIALKKAAVRYRTLGYEKAAVLDAR
jgi:hypothetical protein